MKKIIKIVAHLSSLLSLAVLVVFSGLLGKLVGGGVSGGGALSKLTLGGAEAFSLPHALADAPTTTGDGGDSDCDTSDAGDADCC